MVPSGARAGVPFPQAGDAAPEPSDHGAPRSALKETTPSGGSEGHPDMDVEMETGEATPTKRPAGPAASGGGSALPSIKNLFGIERADNLRDVRRPPSSHTPGSPSAGTRTLVPSMRADRGGPYGHASSGSFSGLSASPSSSLGPIRHRHTSNTGSLGRAAAPGTPPRQTVLPQMMTSEEAGRRRADSRSRQSLKGLLMSPPPPRRPFIEDGQSDYSSTPRRHRPGSSSGSGQMLPGPEYLARASPGHVATLSDPSPGLVAAYPPSSHTSVESSNLDAWGAASTQSESTSPRTSWHSRSSTLESGESSYKMMMGDARAPGLLPSFREPGPSTLELLRRSPEQTVSSLTRHGSLRNPQVPGQPSVARRPRARTLTFTERPIAPLPGSNDPARRQQMEAASELLRMGRGGPAPPSGPPQGRLYNHKHSASMQERLAHPLDLYTSEQVETRGHRPKSSSMSARGPMMPPPPGVPGAPGLQLEPGRPFASFHPRRGRGAADDGMGGPDANFVFPRRPVPNPAEDPRFSSHVMRGQGLASVPDGIVSGSAGPGDSPRGATGTIASGQAKYECAWCGKRFSRPSSLKIHHHSHTGEKPFVCNEPGCGRSFSVQSNLRRHQKCHGPGGEGSDPTGRGHISHSASSSRTDDPEMWPGAPMQPTNRMASPIGHRATSSWHMQHQIPHQHLHQQPHQPGHGRQLSYGAAQQVHDHPPLSRSAFEPGSRSMGSWVEMQHQTGMGPAGPGASLDRPFMQIRDRRLSESSGEEEEPEEDPRGAMAMQARNSPTETALPLRGPASVLSSDEDEHKPGPARMRSGTSGSTSGIRVGFSSLLNPKAEAIDETE